MHTIPTVTIASGIIGITFINPFALGLAGSLDEYFIFIGVGGYIGALAGTSMSDHKNI